MDDASDIGEQFEKFLNAPKQSWLLGAGASFLSNVPLMIPLTKRVFEVLKGETFNQDEEALHVIDYIQQEIPEAAHIEVFLTHLSDLISLAERSRERKLSLGEREIKKEKLVSIHLAILSSIADVIRWGYVRPQQEGQNERIGQPGESIVSIDNHLGFIDSIFFSGRAGLEKLRGPVHFFTTNYDTLIEDALALSQIRYNDGFSGGGIGFYEGIIEEDEDRYSAILVKLHGSIDWFRPTKNPSHLTRIRHGDNYPGPGGQVLIYPQATKYMNAQLDPFLGLFSKFRGRLRDGKDHTLFINGYSFGDDHINTEIETEMARSRSQLTVVAFSEGNDGVLPEALDNWCKSSWGTRVFVATRNGLYRGQEGPYFPVEGGRDWWTFSGASKLLAEGLPSDVTAVME